MAPSNFDIKIKRHPRIQDATEQLAKISSGQKNRELVGMIRPETMIIRR